MKRKTLRYVFIAVPFVTGILFLPIGLPVLAPQPLADLYAKMNIGKAGVLKWEDQKNHALPQDFADMWVGKKRPGKQPPPINRLVKLTTGTSVSSAITMAWLER